MQCTGCGADLDFREAFCSRCGEVTSRGKGASELAGRSVAAILDSIGKLISAGIGYTKNPDNRIKVGMGATAALLLLIAFTNNPISALFSAAPPSPALNEDGTPNFADYEDVFLADQAAYLVTGPANVRDFPTGQGTSVIGSLSEGETVTAREVQAFDSSSEWLKLATGGYVWSSNFRRIGQSGPESPGAAPSAHEFPIYLQGRWSSMDTCRGWDLNAEAIITANTVKLENGFGELVAVTHDNRDRAIYRLAMIGEGEQWEENFAIQIAANGFSITVESLDNPNSPRQTYHNPQVGCGRVFFDR